MWSSVHSVTGQRCLSWLHTPCCKNFLWCGIYPSIPRQKRSHSSFFPRYLPPAARHFMRGKGAGPRLNSWLLAWSLLLNIFQGSHSLKRSFKAINHWKVLEFETLIPVFQNMSVLLPQKVAQICSRAIPHVEWPEAVGRWWYVYIYTLFTDSHYGTWRRIMRLSLC